MGFLYRHKDKGYHIDYAFSSIDRVRQFEIDNSDDWLKISDHLPLVLVRN